MGRAQYSAMLPPVHKCQEGDDWAVLHWRTWCHHSFWTVGQERFGFPTAMLARHWVSSPWWPSPSHALLLRREAAETRALAAASTFAGSETELSSSRVGHTEIPALVLGCPSATMASIVKAHSLQVT